jgi:large exoprotein involved in heme utilization and adhesion
LINAQSLQLNTKGSVTATSANGQGGNIRLQAQNLQLLGNSQISATAGTENKPGDGGNITINADTIVQLANSDITANAFEGNGGRIDINTQGIFRSLDSDIQASSQLGIDGVVNITTPDIKQDNSLAPQSSEFVNAEQVIASSCIARRNVNQGSFVITGTGGLQDSPSDNFDLDYAVVSVGAIGKLAIQPSNTNVAWSRGAEIKEATQLITTEDGRLLLTAYPKGQINSTQDLTCS